MLYLIGGTSRSGKSTIAKRILAKANIAYLSTDWIMMGFTNGIPEYGIHDELFPDEIGRRMWKFVRAMCENIIWTGKDYVIEGEAILPEQARELILKYPGKVKVCFVGYAEIDTSKKLHEIKTFCEDSKDWLSSKPDEYIINHINNMIDFSLQIKKQCELHNLKYFDTSYNFIDAVDKSIEYLIGDAYRFNTSK